MTAIRTLILASFLFCHPIQAASILILGDSLSAAYGFHIQDGWVARLQQEHPEHTFINTSISGETTLGGLTRLPPLLTQHEPDILVIELGANDGLRGLPIQHIEKNLTAIITAGKQADARILLLGIRLPPNFGARYSHALAQLYPELAKTHQTAVVPLFPGIHRCQQYPFPA
jgi:acyl-CoA thioesterase-1